MKNIFLLRNRPTWGGKLTSSVLGGVVVIALTVLPTIGASASGPVVGGSPDVTVGGGGSPTPPAGCSSFEWGFTGGGQQSPAFGTAPTGSCGSTFYVGFSTTNEDYLGQGFFDTGYGGITLQGSEGWVWDGPANPNWVSLGGGITGAIGGNWVLSGSNVPTTQVYIAAN